MGQKKMQGADGMNFQLQLTIKGLESINLPEESLKNESGNDIMKISCWGGKLSAYVNLPNAIRPNNVQPFQLSDCIKIELVRNQVIEHMRLYLQNHLKDKYSDEFLSMMSVTKMECNLTIKCVGNCKPKDVIRLFEKSFAMTLMQKKCHLKILHTSGSKVLRITLHTEHTSTTSICLKAESFRILRVINSHTLKHRMLKPF